ncbi:MAG: hypothetical protein II841_03020 [Bacteroidales bacterium]|nr:hypothetical protein [Bacteroidales bacterium]
MPDNKRKLYDALSQTYDLGTFETFSADLEDEEKRKKAYKAVSQSYDVGDYDTFSASLGFTQKAAPVQEDQTAAVRQDSDDSDLNFDDEPQGPARQVSTPQSTENPMLQKFRLEKEMENLGQRPVSMSDEDIENQITMDIAGADPEILWAQAQDLYKSGAISRQEYEDARKQHDADVAAGTSDKMQENRDAAREEYRKNIRARESEEQQAYDTEMSRLQSEYGNNPLVKQERLLEQLEKDRLDAERMAQADAEEIANKGVVRGLGGGLSAGWDRMVAGLGNLVGEGITSVQKAFGVDGSADQYAYGLLYNFITQTGGKGSLEDLLYETDPATGAKLPRGPYEIMGMQDKKGKVLFGEDRENFYKGQQVINALQRAYKQSGGDMSKAYEYLKEQAGDLPLGMTISEGAQMALAEVPETKGFGAWLGGQIPMLLPTAAAIGLSFVPGGQEAGAVLGKATFGMMAASSAGESMAQARQYGASDSEVWAAGLADAAIMYAAGKIPFNRYTKRLFGTASKQISAELSSALADESSLAAHEAERLWQRASKELGKDLMSASTFKGWLADIAAHGGTMASMSALQTIVPMIYENPEDYPTLNEILSNGLRGFRDGVFLGTVLGGASRVAEWKHNQSRWQKQGYILYGELKPDGNGGGGGIAEVVGWDKEKGTYTVRQNGKEFDVARDAFSEVGIYRYADAEKAYMRINTDEAYEQGRELIEAGDRHDAQNMYEAQRQKMQEATGLQDVTVDDVMMYYESENWTPEQKMAVQDYLNAKSAREGMIDGIRDDIQRKVIAATTAIDNNTSKTDGMVHPATMKDDRRAYVVDGTVVMTEDGATVDHTKSMHDLLMRDAETGELFFASVDQILSVDEAIDPLAEKKTIVEQIRQSIAQQAADEIDGNITIDAQQSYNILNPADGSFVNVKVLPIQDEKTGEVSLVNAEGLLTLVDENGNPVMQASEADLRTAVEAANIKRLDNYIAKLDEIRSRYPGPDDNLPADTAPVQWQTPAAPVGEAPAAEPVEEQPIIPIDDKGRKQYMQAPKEATYEDIYSDEDFETDDEAYGFISGKVKRAEEALKKQQTAVDKIKPENFDTPKEYRAAKDAALEAARPFQETYDYWKSVLDLADADIAAAKEREARAARMEEAALQEPHTLDELVANAFRGAQHTLNREDFKRETGLGNTEMSKFFPFWAKKGQGLSVTALAESIAADEDGTGLVPQMGEVDQADVNTVRSAVIDVFRSATRPTDLYEYTRNANLRRQAEMERAAAEAEERARLEAEAAAAAQEEEPVVEEPAAPVVEEPETPTAPEAETPQTPLQQTIAEEAAKVNPEPTEAQKEAGNYQKGHVQVDGFDITIETAKGTVRRGTDPDGKPWESEMHQNYGYIRRTEGTDGDHIDVFLSDAPEQGNVFVVDQVDPKTGAFDEHKVMYGFNSLEEARAAYLSNYEEGWQGLGNITEVTREEFKKWVNSSHRKTKPFAEYKSVKPVEASETPAVELSSENYEKAQATYKNPAEATPEELAFAFDFFEKDLARNQEILARQQEFKAAGSPNYSELTESGVKKAIETGNKKLRAIQKEIDKRTGVETVEAKVEEPAAPAEPTQGVINFDNSGITAEEAESIWKYRATSPMQDLKKAIDFYAAVGDEASLKKVADLTPEYENKRQIYGPHDSTPSGKKEMGAAKTAPAPATLAEAQKQLEDALEVPKGYYLYNDNTRDIVASVLARRTINEMDNSGGKLATDERVDAERRPRYIEVVRNYIDKLAEQYGAEVESLGGPEKIVSDLSARLDELNKTAQNDGINPDEYEAVVAEALKPVGKALYKMRYDAEHTTEGNKAYQKAVEDLMSGASDEVVARLSDIDNLPENARLTLRDIHNARERRAETRKARQDYFDSKLEGIPFTPFADIKKGKFDIWNFTEKRKKSDLPRGYDGVLRDKGHLIASDGHVMVALKEKYPKSEEGKTFIKSGEEIGTHDTVRNNWQGLLEAAKEPTDIDWKHLTSFVNGVKQVMGKEFKNQHIAVKIGDDVYGFRADALDSFLQAARELDANDVKAAFIAGGKGVNLKVEGSKGASLVIGTTRMANADAPTVHYYPSIADVKDIEAKRAQAKVVAEATSFVTGKPVEEILEEQKPVQKSRNYVEEWKRTEDTMRDAVTPEDVDNVMRERRNVLQGRINEISDDAHPATVTTRADVSAQLIEDGCSQEVVSIVEDELVRSKKYHYDLQGFRVGGHGIYIIADDIVDLEAGIDAYVHEREHDITEAEGYVNQLIALDGIDKPALEDIVTKLSGSANNYAGADIEELADEAISMGMVEAYRTKEGQLEDTLRAKGIDNESFITFVKNLDNEQRNSDTLRKAREGRELREIQPADTEGAGRQDGGTPEGESGEVRSEEAGGRDNGISRPRPGARRSGRTPSGEVKSGPSRQIEDFGEKIAGARKDELRNLAKTLEDATEESFVALPLAKAFKRPNTKKLIENGVISPEDAALVDAVSWLILGSPKPVKLKDRSYRAKRRDQEIVDWAKQQAQRAKVVLDYINADEAGRKAIIDELANVPEDVKMSADAHREYIKDLNRDWKEVQSGDLYPLNPVYVAYRLFQSTGYDPDVYGRVKFPSIECNDMGRYYTVKSGNYGCEYAYSVDDALKQATYLVQLQMGVEDLDHPANVFKIKGIRDTKVGTGKYRVNYWKAKGRGYPSYETAEFDSKDAAMEFARKKYPDTKDEDLLAKAVEEIQKWADPTKFKVVCVNAATGEDYELDTVYGSKEEAISAIDSNHEELNSQYNAALQAVREAKGENVNKRDKLYIAWYYEGGKGSYGVWAKDKGFWQGNELLKGGFETSKDARAYMEEHRSEYEAQLKEMAKKRSEFVYFDGDAAARKGKDYRHGKDVGEEEYKVFGFRGVQFGNWANDKDRQAALNNAYDSFMNLAELLGVSPAAISLNGELGLAFGARGSGSANAHYESNEVVINLTKTRGAGSLAHEWWHALDNYFARHGGIAHGFITASHIQGVRPEVQQAFTELSRAIRQSDYGRRSVQKGDYWGSDWEMTARLFAEWVDRKIAANGERDHFLVRGVSDEKARQWRELGYRFYEIRMENRNNNLPDDKKEKVLSYEEYCKTPDALSGFPYPTTEEINTTFGHLMQKVFDTIQEKTEDGKQVLFSKVYHGSAANFDQFDLQFLGSGEGNYVYGPGIYVTEVDGIAKSYADVAVGNRLGEVRDGIERQQERLQEIRAGYPAKIKHHEEMAEKFAGTWGGETHKKFADYFRYMLETGDYKYDPEAQQVSDNIKWRQEQLNTDGKRHLYTVEIPDDNGHNYITYGEELPWGDAMRIKAALRARLLADVDSGWGAYNNRELDQELNMTFKSMWGENILGTLDAYLGNDGVGLKSTRFLHELGYVGMKVDTNYQDPNGDHSANNYVIFDPKDAKITEHVRYSKINQWPAEDREQSRVRFSKVTDKKVLDELEKGQTEIGFRNVVLNEDGSLGSPMADRLGKKGQKSVATTPFSFDEWEQSDEHPEMATDEGKINLIKPDKLGNVDAVDYNPYIHIRPTLINKQFTGAWKRPNLVYVATAYPTSELTSGYHAEKAAKAVGRHDWNGGELILSRFDKPVRIVPWDEVADAWEQEFKDRGVTFDIVPPGLLPVLAERGVEILPPKAAAGAPAMAAYNRWANGGSVRFSKMYHGSGADFDRFDSSHIGEGEGAQAHGYGHYVTEKESTAGRYANSFAKSDPLHDQIVEARRKNSERKRKILSAALYDKEPAAKAEWDRLNEDDERLTDLLRMANNPVRPKALSMDMSREDAALYEAASKYIGTYGFENAQAFKDLGSYNYARNEEKAAIDLIANSSKEDWEFARNLYHVEIPDDTGENYIDEMKTLAKPLRKKIADVVRELPESKLDRNFHGPNWLPQGFQTLANIIEREQYAGLEIRQRLEDALGNTNAARKETSEILHKAGFVGMKYDGRVDGPCAVIFDDNDIKVREHVRFSKVNTDERIFISNAEQAAGRIKMEKATPEQWLKMLEKEGGLKAGEDKWIGLSDWLRASDKKTITKQEVLDHIRQNEIVIEEDHYSQNANLDENERMLDLREEFLELVEEGDEETGSIYVADHADWALQQMIDRYGDDFGQAFEWVYDDNRYPKLDAIYDTYEDGITEAARYFLGIIDKPIYNTRLDYTTEGLSNKHEIALTVPTIAPWNESDKVHFGDAGEGRAVAWIRFGDAVVGLNGKALVIDEIQSKRHQEGREHGYKDPHLEEVQERIGYLGRVRNGFIYDKEGEKIPFTNEMKAELQSLEEERQRLMGTEWHLRPSEIELQEDERRYFTVYDGQQYNVGKNTVFSEEEARSYLADSINSGISRRNNARVDHERQKPRPAPFEKNWHELAFKRMLRYAADEGYDVIAWTTGEQQAERYDIGNAIDYLYVDKRADQDNRFVMVKPLYGSDTYELLFDEKGIITDGSIEGESLEGKSLGEVFGKEVSVRILSAENGDNISLQGQRIGGDGMKGFYDDILPRFVNKYGKKWGVKVEDITLYDIGEGGYPLTMHSVKVTPEMKESVKKGQVMFSKVNRFAKDEAEFDETFKQAKKDKGTVIGGLADTQFPILGIERHPFEGRGKDAIRKAREWAEENLVGEHTYHDGKDDSFVYAITGGKDGSIGKFLSQSSTGNSDNLGIHLATLMRLPEIIDKSIDVEIHPSYNKVDNKRSIANGIESEDILIHRLYGAIELDGNVYRVKTTMNEHRNSQNEAHDYRVTKVELLESNPTKDTDAHVSGSSTSDAQGAPATITGANLLKDVEKSYDSGKKLLAESAKVHWSKLSRPVDEIVEEGRMKVAEENDEARAKLNTRMRAIDKNLAKMRMAASAQREYDRETVRSITDLAKELLDNGALSDVTRQEIQKMLTVTRWATGRKDLQGAVDAIMDLMVANQLRHSKGVLDGLLKIRGSKVDAKGVEVQGKLDAPGQRTMQVFKDAMDMSLESIDEHIAAAEERLDSSDDTIKAAAGDELAGLQMARKYVENIKSSIDEEKGIKNELRQAAEDRRAGKMAPASYREFVESSEEALRENRMERIEAYNELVDGLSKMLYDSITRGTAFREAEKSRVEQIHHYANSDLEGRKDDEHGNKNDRFANNGFLRFFLKPLATFDQMLRHFGSKSVNGEGYLWNHFMRGWVDANDAEFKGFQEATKVLDDKVSDVFGRKMRWSDLYSVERGMPTVDVKFWDGGKMQDHKLTQGNLLYIYMVNKMSDGRMKLRRMGIEEEHVQAIKAQMDPRFIELADWLQEEFLVNIRNKYNKVHEQMFGAPMAAIDNYFPLKILANARVREVDMSTPDMDGTTPATITGSIIKRRRNGLALDVLGSDAFSVVIEHLQQMEHWAAFAPFNRDLNTLLSYKKFRNKVQNMAGIYGAGSVIWENFRKSAEIAAGVYHPAVTKDSVDSTAVNIAKGVTAAKISFRVYTAVKQLLSMPAFVSDSTPVELGKSLATPWKSWNWAMEELPGFEKRWKSRQAGDTRLMKTDSDWKMWRSNIVQTAGRLGMSPNAFVDALTVSIGAKAMYETKKARYIKDGYTEEQADKRAKQDATILFNETQQSNENAFLSAMQLDRTWASVALTVFRNSSMGFQRQLVDAVRNLGHKFTPGYKDKAIEFMTKQMVRDGVDEDDARGAAERNYKRSTFRDAMRVALFGFIMQFAWNLGAYLPYLIAGDDDDEKKKMLQDAARHGIVGGTVEGLTGGSVISEAANMLASGESVQNYNPSLMPVASDIQKIIKMMSYDQVAAANEILNLLVQAGVGVNPQTLTDIGVAIYDACNGDLETSKEATLAIMRILQVPQSQTDKVYMDEIDFTAEKGLDLQIGEFAKRYADYKVKRGAPLLGWAYSDENKEKRVDAYSKRFTKQAQELIRTRGNDIDRAYYEYVDTEHKEVDATLRDLRTGQKAAMQSGDQMGAMEYAQMMSDFMQTDEFQRYARAHGNVLAIKRLQTALKNASSRDRDGIEDQLLQLKRQLVNDLQTDNK